MPVLRMNMGKSPDYAAGVQSGPDIRVFENVRAIVVVNETEVRGLEEDERNQSGQAEINGDESSSSTTHQLPRQGELIPQKWFPRHASGR